MLSWNVRCNRRRHFHKSWNLWFLCLPYPYVHELCNNLQKQKLNHWEAVQNFYLQEEIYISLYHQLKAGKSNEDSDDIDDSEEKEDKNYYKKLPRDFFDLIVVDECHRSSLNEEKGWHKMLEYFDSATLIGLKYCFRTV